MLAIGGSQDALEVGRNLAGRVRRRRDRRCDGAPLASLERIEELDRQLARLARSAGRLRLELGRGLEELERSGGRRELAFPSIEAYALERCERSSSWVQKSRRLARRLEELPLTRASLISGRISWSAAAALAGITTAEDEARWLADAGRSTLRELKELIATRTPSGRSSEQDACERDEPLRTLSLTVPREDAWLFEGTRLLAKHLGEHTLSDAMFALVTEATTTAIQRWPEQSFVIDDDSDDRVQCAWEAELRRMRKDAERLCEERIRAHSPGSYEATEDIHPLGWEGSATTLDAQLRAVAAELDARELGFGRALELFFGADGWRRLGYATAAHYARERLSMSLSSLKAKRHLARRLTKLPALEHAFEQAELGYEATRLVANVATPQTAEQWVTCARERTLVNLRQDIDAAELVARWTESGAPLPPTKTVLEQAAALEREIAKGAPVGEAAARAGLMGGQNSARRGIVTLRLRVPATIASDYRRLEAIYLRRTPRTERTSFLRFACESFLETWRRERPAVAYGHIHERDLFRCQNPVCGRKDVTPHHLRFRSQGGDDSDANVISLCTVCHLEGVHGGCLRATPPADAVRWTLGRVPHTIVEGRKRVRLG